MAIPHPSPRPQSSPTSWAASILHRSWSAPRGVIGAPLRVEKILAAVPHLALTRSAEAAAFEEFARSIMTTDTRPKWAVARCRIGGKEVRFLGCAKGSGMIQPNMATMLAFVTTDAAISPALLSRGLRDVVGSTFNSITVDGDTSTNDTVAVLANGRSGAPRISDAGRGLPKLRCCPRKRLHVTRTFYCGRWRRCSARIEIEVKARRPIALRIRSRARSPIRPL